MNRRRPIYRASILRAPTTPAATEEERIIEPIPQEPRRSRMGGLGMTLAVLVVIALGVNFFAGPARSRVEASVGEESTKPGKEGKSKESKEQKAQREAWEFFNGPVTTIEIEIDAENLDYLRKDARRYAECVVKENGVVYKNTMVKLKGAAGSFRGVDDKAGFTFNFDKLKGSSAFHGLRKLHLNNCAQDGTYLHEMLAGEWSRAAGVPASRCTHAFVTVNGKDRGLYVVKEAFSKEFLSHFFTNTDGNLYDGGFCREIAPDLERDLGSGDNSDLKEFVAACNEGDNAKRWERLSKILDVDRFAAFCAMEAFTCHWDGYNFNRNNFRLYCDPTNGKFHFFMHGTDQTFTDPNIPILRDFGTMAGGAFMRCPEGAKLYRAKLDELYNDVLKPTDWAARAVEIGNKVRDALAVKNANWAKDYQGQINAVRDQMAARVAVVGKALGDMPKAFEFKNGVAKLDAKNWRVEGGAAQADEVAHDGKPCFHLRSEGGAGSWRRAIHLPPGKYRFEARIATKGVAAVDSGSGEGAGLRISGIKRNGLNALAGDSAWKDVTFDFESAGETVLVAELSASKGEAWFDKESLRLVEVK